MVCLPSRNKSNVTEENKAKGQSVPSKEISEKSSCVAITPDLGRLSPGPQLPMAILKDPVNAVWTVKGQQKELDFHNDSFVSSRGPHPVRPRMFKYKAVSESLDKLYASVSSQR